MSDKELIAEARLRAMIGADVDPIDAAQLLNELADALEAATRVPVQGEPNDDRETLARVLYIASDDFAFADRMAKTWDAPGPHGRQRWYRYADAVIAAGFSRATVPDAATEALRADKMTAEEAIESVLKRPGMYGLVPKNEHRSMKAERDAALAAVERAQAIHTPSDGLKIPRTFAGEPEHSCRACLQAFPCPTVAALDGAPEPEAVEWEYAVGGMNLGSTEAWAHDEDDISSNFDTARAWTDEAIASGSFSNAIVVKRRFNPWLPVEEEKS